MKFDLRIGSGEEATEEALELLEPAPACRFRLGDKIIEADARLVAPNVYSILIGGRSYQARVEEATDGLAVVVNGFRFRVEVRDPRQWRRSALDAASEGVQTVVAPMPGKVVRVLVQPGDAVEAGQGIIVVEAMKMQNEMKAARPGRLLSVAVQPGATVVAGEVLARIG